MANNFKFNKEGNEKNSIFKGKWAVGLTSGMGPTEQTDFYNGITPPVGGYSLYLNKPSGGPSVYTPSSDGELIELINTSFNKNFSNIEDCLEFISIDDDLFCQKNNIDKIITDGLVLYLDASNLMSYPKKGKTWKDLSGNSNDGTLENGPTFNSDNLGSLVFDGTDSKITLNTTEFTSTEPWTILFWVNFENVNKHIHLTGVPDTHPTNWTPLSHYGAELHQQKFVQAWWDNNSWRYSSTPLIKNKWHQVGLSFDGDNKIKFLKDGIIDKITEGGSQFNPIARLGAIGYRQHANDRYLEGKNIFR